MKMRGAEVRGHYTAGDNVFGEDPKFQDWLQRALELIAKDIERTKPVVDNPNEVRAAIEAHNAKFPDDPSMQIGFSRILTLGRGVFGSFPLMDEWYRPLNDELERSDLRERFDSYREAHALNEMNRVAQEYLKIINCEVGEPVGWVMHYGLKAPILTKEEYEKRSSIEDFDSLKTQAATRSEMKEILNALGYADDCRY